MIFRIENSTIADNDISNFGGVMIDLKFLRENPEVVKENIKKKFQEHKLPLVDEVIELDGQKDSAGS